MADNNLFHIQSSWFLCDETVNTENTLQASTITIDLSKNQIKEIPSDTLWKLEKLTDLDVSHNMLEKICDPVTESLDTLDLTGSW